MSPSVEVVQGFGDAHREAAALLYDEAFGAKLGLAIADRAQRRRVLAAALRPSHAYVALSEGRLLGIAGFKDAHGGFTAGLDFALLRRHLGTLPALRAIAVLALFERTPSDGLLLMDGICVDAAARGCGVGSMLLERLKARGRADGCRALRLDVIDTNAAARRLYERSGFVASETARFGWLRGWLGFGAATTMLCPLDRPQPLA